MSGVRAHHKVKVAPQFSDDALLDELAQIWGLCGTERLTVAQYRAHGGQHSVSTYLSRFGSWAMATMLAAQERPQVAQLGQRKRRTCLAPDCGRIFASDGPHHRICSRHEKSRHDQAQGGAPVRQGTLRVPVERDGWRI